MKQQKNTGITPTYFMSYIDQYEVIEVLTDEQIGMLYRAIYRYAFSGVIKEPLDPIAKVVFRVMRLQVERDAEKYAAKVENGRRGGRPKKSAQKPDEAQKTAFPCESNVAPKTEHNQEKEKEKEEEKEYENEKEYSFSSDGITEEKQYSPMSDEALKKSPSPLPRGGRMSETERILLEEEALAAARAGDGRAADGGSSAGGSRDGGSPDSPSQVSHSQDHSSPSLSSPSCGSPDGGYGDDTVHVADLSDEDIEKLYCAIYPDRETVTRYANMAKERLRKPQRSSLSPAKKAPCDKGAQRRIQL